MRLFVLFALLSIFIWGVEIDTKIQKSRKELQKTTSRIKGLNVRLNKLARNIKKLQKELAQIDEKLQRIDTLLKNANMQYNRKLAEYNLTKKSIEKLALQEGELKQKLVLLLSQLFSKSLLLTSMQNPTEEDILKEEVLKAIQKSADFRLRRVSKRYSDIRNRLLSSKIKLARLEKEIAQLLRSKKELKNLRLKKTRKLTALNEAKRRYNAEIQKLIEQQKSLQATLRRLKILKTSLESSSASSRVKVKKYGEKSYQKIRTVRYRGPKTIAPLEKFIIIKRYGIYKDPIYKIDIPNENVELKPLLPNAKVRNVLNGRIVLAKWTPYLKHVVIVKHRNGLYTIYAYLDRLAPFIKQGRKIKRGHIIGRVSSKLIFEVTKNNAHINPLDLIKVN